MLRRGDSGAMHSESGVSLSPTVTTVTSRLSPSSPFPHSIPSRALPRPPSPFKISSLREMTIVEQQEIMNAGQNLEEELEGSDHENYSDDGVEGGVADAGSDDDAALTGPGNTEVAEWVSLENHPPPTAARILNSLRAVASRGRNTLTILVLGRSGNGKSSTVNSIFASTVAQAVPFHVLRLQAVQPLVVRKKADGVTLTVIDTAGPIDSDNVSEQLLRRIAYQARHIPVDVVLFLDRFDVPYADELDRQLIASMTRVFGSEIWPRVVIGLTHADIRDPAADQNYETMIEKRVAGLRDMMKKAGSRDAALPYVLIENSDRCQRNASREKVLSNGTVWVPTFFETVAQVAQSFPSAYKYNPKMVNRRDQFIAKFIYIPCILLLQIFCKIVILDPVIHQDGLRGDRYGRFEQNYDEYEKRRQERRSKGKQKSVRERSLEDEMTADDSEDEFED